MACQFECNQKSVISRHIYDKHMNLKNPFETVDTFNETKFWEKILTSNRNWFQGSNPNDKQNLNLPPLLEPALPFGIEATPQPWNPIFANNSQWLEQISMASISPQKSKGLDINGLNEGFDERKVQKKVR